MVSGEQRVVRSENNAMPQRETTKKGEKSTLQVFISMERTYPGEYH